MSHLTGLRVGMAWLLSCAGALSADVPDGMAPQSPPVVTRGSSDSWNTAWQGVPGRTYLMEWSADAVTWNTLPLTEAGAGTKAYSGRNTAASKFFVRLLSSDETPDLATATNWEPPLLRVAGDWTVATTHKDKTAAAGVRLSVYRWPAAAAAPLTTPLTTAATGTDGTYTFDPSALGTDDRVEVRITGSPNQRVYLPWIDGHEPEPGTISLGGGGLALTGLLAGSGTGQTPDYTALPGGRPSVVSPPIYRLEDFMGVVAWEALYDEMTLTESKVSNHALVDSCLGSWGWPAGIWQGLMAFDFKITPTFGPGVSLTTQRTLFLANTHGDVRGTMDLKQATDGLSSVAPVDVVLSDVQPYEIDQASLPMDQQFFARRSLVLGPVPMDVPKDVIFGKPLYYTDIKVLDFRSELPLGVPLTCEYVVDNPASPGTPLYKQGLTKITWKAELLAGAADCDVTLLDDAFLVTQYDSNGVGHKVSWNKDPVPFGPTAVIDTTSPGITLKFQPKNEVDGIVFSKRLQVRMSASIALLQDDYETYGEPIPLGSYTRDLIYTSAVNTPAALAKRQPAELHGLTGDSPEGDGFNGGQRSKTLEPERRIGVNGLPAPASPTFVDALTGRFHHSELDFSLAIPGSDLSLSVERSATDSIWTDAFGLRPTENPLLAFGPGWDTNLSASLLRVRSLLADGSVPVAAEGDSRLLKSTISVRDYRGGAFSFLEYTGGDGNTSYIPDPTMLPERGTTGISLSGDTTGNVLTLFQPLLGLTHVFTKTTVDFQIPNNRDTPTTDGQNPSGYTGYQYYRLVSVTDRFGVQLSYQYGDTSPQNLIPQLVSVVGRTALQLRIQQSGGRIQAFWDPSGIKHAYAYEGRGLTPLGGGTDASFDILASHQIGSLTAASYGYQYAIEADPRLSAMLLQTTDSTAYTIPTYHIAPSSIANGKSDTLTINYQPSHTRWSFSSADNDYYHPSGDPLLVQSIVLPNTRSVAFNLLHTLKNGRTGRPANGDVAAVTAVSPVLSIFTVVTDMWGNHWTYNYATPTSYPWVLPDDDAPVLPTASALFFPKLTRYCSEVADSSVQYSYDATAGFELSLTKDTANRTNAANRTRSATHSEAFTHPTSPYLAPLVSASARIHDHYALPSTTTDVLGHTSTYHYVSGGGNPLKLYLADTITDSRQRVIALDRDTLARTLSIKLLSATNDTLSETDFAYADGTSPGAVTKTTRKAIDGADDPAWVTDLVKDILLDRYGFASRIGNDAAGLHTTITRSPAGRVLAVESPNGGTRSNVYDSSGLLEATWLEDGSNVTYQHDRAGRTVLTRDALGHATGVIIDPMGRVTTAVRDMDGNLSYDPATDVFSGIDATRDIVSTAEYQDDTHKVRLTDPRGYVSFRVLDALGRTTKTITPRNELAPGTDPADPADCVTSLTYDLVQSPTLPVKITDPLGYETILKFDDFARLEETLRQYGSENSTKLYSGTIYGFDHDTGLPTSITAIRTPLDSTGAPTGSNAIQQLTSSITLDPLDRAATSVFAEGTDQEIRTRTSYTSTGIRYKDETRDALAGEGTSEHWSARETACDTLGRPVSESLPAVIDAITGDPANPITNIIYDTCGQIEKLTDAYNNATSFGHDVLGNVSYKKSPAVVDAKSGQLSQPITIYQYDTAGWLAHVVDPLGYAWSYERDAAGRVTKTTGPVVSPAADATHRQQVWQSFHDPAGNLTQAIDPEGHSTTHTYWPNNSLASTTTPVTFTDDSGAPHLVDVLEQYQRDAMGRLTGLIDGNNQATAFTRDGLGRTLTTTRDSDDTARAKIESITYDALLPIATVDAKNQRKELLYNDQFRLETISVTGAPAESLTFLHDLLGRVTNIDPTTAPTDLSMGNPSIARSYDVLGRLESETSNGVTTTNGYDLLNRIAKVTTSIPDTNGGGATVGRDLGIQHDALGRTVRVADTTNGATLVTTFGHDLAGNQVLESMSNGLTQAFDFDPIGRVTSERVRNANGDVLCKTDRQYDLVSNVTHIEETTAALSVPNRVIDNTYNERNQLLTETQSETGGILGSAIRTRSEVHRYDYAENRISSTSATHDPLATIQDSTLTRLFEYGNATNGRNSNQLYQLTETPGGGTSATTTYEYDNNGNRTGRTVGELSDTYTYDTSDRLTQLILNTSASAENGTYNYAYDPLTRRISRSVDVWPTTSIHLFAFSGNTPVHEWDSAINNGSLVSNIGGGVGGRLYSQDTSGLTTYPFHNARGDVIAQFTGGTMTYHATYAASGMLQSLAGTRTGNYGANGKWEEPGGLINDGFRYRDRLTDTFLTPDPAGFIDGPNTYNYVGHNPWSDWDPNGLANVNVSAASTPGEGAGIGSAPTGNNNATVTCFEVVGLNLPSNFMTLLAGVAGLGEGAVEGAKNMNEVAKIEGGWGGNLRTMGNSAYEDMYGEVERSATQGAYLAHQMEQSGASSESSTATGIAYALFEVIGGKDLIEAEHAKELTFTAAGGVSTRDLSSEEVRGKVIGGVLKLGVTTVSAVSGSIAATRAVAGMGERLVAAVVKQEASAAAKEAETALASVTKTAVHSMGGEVLPATTVRTIAKGETIAALETELAELTYKSGGLEHAVISLQNGERVIVSGGRGGIEFGRDLNRVIGHTHPTPTGPSPADFQMLKDTGQQHSYIYELFGGGRSRFNLKE